MTATLPPHGTATVAPGPGTPAGWWPLALSDDVRASGRTPLTVSIQGSPWAVVVLDGEIAALRDLCPHRRVPLSAGTVADQASGQVLECGYHGWSYDRNGQCASIPALGEGRVPRGMGSVAALRTVVSGGVVWGTVDTDRAGPLPEIGPGHISLRPQTVPQPVAEVIAALTGEHDREHAAGTRLTVAGSDLGYHVRPADTGTTVVFPLVSTTAPAAQTAAWSVHLDRLTASSPTR